MMTLNVLSENFWAELDAIPIAKPVEVRIEGITRESAAEWVNSLWKWKFHGGIRDRANLVIVWDCARCAVVWDGRITALLNEHHPSGARGFINHYFEITE